ncbi:gliding motility-associated C-terminal domain-containing protein, partial [Paenimyroides baculatum]
TDACGNSVSTVSTFTIVDTTKPVFTTEPQNEVVECDGSGNTAAYNAWLANHGGGIATDNCGAVTYTYSVVDTAVLCGKTSKTTVRFRATDECGNHISKEATFTITDTTAPDFITEPEDVTVECDGNGNINDLNAWINSYGGATAQDLCSTEVKWSHNFKGLKTTCGGAAAAEVIFTATDACGNSSSRTATFRIVDTTAPEFVSDLPVKEIFIKCEELKDAEVLKATDNCGSATVTVSDEVVPSACGDTKYTILRTWIATDDCGNETSYTQTIHLACKIEVFNAVTPNGDGYNDELVLKGIDCYPGNRVDIYNRWGVLVYETKNYNSNGNTFKGYANGRVTVSKDSMLPTGTYYYVIKYDYDLGNGQVYPIEQAGYLHLETTK